jgi:predicted regulator of Ras-like GTPase activity (Roadblock/LC7/MglB family)
VSIESVLSELVSSVEGATGAIILAVDGEAVQWHTAVDGDRLRLRGAYVALAVQSYRDSPAHKKFGAVKNLVLEYEESSFVAQEIDSDCFVAIELTHHANIGEAMFRLGPAVEKLRKLME